ncbi:TRAP transporter substrate-binding protein [Paenibacillus doosanensis]|uniref:2,3-diketo-L-gulonate-binding periplasmic protein YiaO n=1 Tax=Paenibacillus konkukensis TaxID=2020716 RepID=A0ABY4RP18_9BACL|nr:MULTISPECIES: TRAP transporter substrate-binding protein [Paenibacillus]MCS7461736.1 TRAP transporter substrate-binding protein [Paenibacillus doosanensis]UQZ83576.1 2,3-diketo-L-gulonate-binding periplasmic protein YiaO precursor [Paenibacillus konkukensis]
MMLKKIGVLALTVVLGASLAACGQKGGTQGADSAAGGASAKPVKLKLGHIAGEDDPWNTGAKKFAELVKQKTNGSVQIDLYPSSTLGNDRDLIEGMQLGSIDFALVAGVLSNFYEPFSILELPYLFRDKEHMDKVLYGPVGEKLKEDLLKNAQIRGLQFWERTPRELTANKKITTPADLNGLKIRVPEIPASIAAWKAMGATPTPMAFSEVYSSLQTGVIDAQENPLALMTSSKLQEVQKYLINTNHVYGYVMLTMSDITYKKLTPDQQKAVEEAAKEATDFENKLVFDQEKELLKKVTDAGMEVVDIDTKPFIEKAKTVHAEFAKKSPADQELYDGIMNTK